MLLSLPFWFCDQTVIRHIDKSMANVNRATVEAFSVTVAGRATKRKRSSSDEKDFAVSCNLHDLKHQRDLTALRSPVSPLADKFDGEAELSLNLNAIINTIKHQFSLEILLKHNELRVINQEIAKCQIALEQLRRCHLIPFPVNMETTEAKLLVTDGTAPALSKANKSAPWAPPFGVTDGPYTRHYAKWLIPDSKFDGKVRNVAHESRTQDSASKGRTTRHSYIETTAKACKSELPGASSQKLHALQGRVPRSKDRSGPCVLKLKDGRTVKLVCPICQRDNFSSAQGFINHCRISHHYDFKSHEEAANACGQPVEINETGGIICNEGNLATSDSLVHPLIRNLPTGKDARDACRALLDRVADSATMLLEGRLPGFTSIPKSAQTYSYSSNSPLPSSLTPHLSELMYRRGFQGSVDKIVQEVQQKFEYDECQAEKELEATEKPPFSNTQTNKITDPPETPYSSPIQRRISASVSLSPSSQIFSESAKCFSKRTLDHYRDDIAACHPTLASVTHIKNTVLPAQDLFVPSSHNKGLGIKVLTGTSINDIGSRISTSHNAPSLVSDDGEYDEDGVESARTEDEIDESDITEIGMEEEAEQRTVLRNCASEHSKVTRHLNTFL